MTTGVAIRLLSPIPFGACSKRGCWLTRVVLCDRLGKLHVNAHLGLGFINVHTTTETDVVVIINCIPAPRGSLFHSRAFCCSPSCCGSPRHTVKQRKNRCSL